MKKESVQIYIDEGLKREITGLFDDLGLDLSTAVNLFLHQCIFHGGLPFLITIPDLSEITKEAIQEVFAIPDNEQK